MTEQAYNNSKKLLHDMALSKAFNDKQLEEVFNECVALAKVYSDPPLMYKTMAYAAMIVNRHEMQLSTNPVQCTTGQ